MLYFRKKNFAMKNDDLPSVFWVLERGGSHIKVSKMNVVIPLDSIHSLFLEKFILYAPCSRTKIKFSGKKLWGFIVVSFGAYSIKRILPIPKRPWLSLFPKKKLCLHLLIQVQSPGIILRKKFFVLVESN